MKPFTCDNFKKVICKKCGEIVRIVKEYQSDDLEDYYMLGEGL